MKMKNGLIIVALVLLFGMSNTFAQFSFSVSPGIGFSNAKFGYKINDKIVPYVGFQYLKAKYTWEEAGERIDWQRNRIVEYEETTEFKGSLFMPNIGVKMFLSQNEKIKSFANLNFSKPFLNGEVEYDGDIDDDFEENVNNLKLWGAEASFGAEYYFDEHFSLGGEFGLRYFHLKYKEETERQTYNPYTGDPEELDVETDVNFALNPTFSRISLNFYF